MFSPVIFLLIVIFQSLIYLNQHKWDVVHVELPELKSKAVRAMAAAVRVDATG